jgi:SAM-dependent methyltransferase
VTVHPRHTPAGDGRRANWTQHWAGGARHSCSGSYGAEYGGAIAAFWQSVADETPDRARVLDLATGAGAVPRLLRQLAPAKRWSMTAVDFSDHRPPPEADDGDAGVSYHPGVSIESMPFGDGSFDLVTSQYGFEYAALDAAAREVRRVRAPGSRLAFVMHHASSRPVELARVEIGHIDALQGDLGFLAATRAMLVPMARAATAAGRAALASDASANAARRAFNDAQDLLTQRIQARPDGSDVLHEARDAAAACLGMAQQRGHGPADAAWQAWIEQLADARQRLFDLIQCSLDATALDGLVQILRIDQEGMRISPVNEGTHLMGWALRLG